MSDKTYNGWTNYETWTVNLYMDNEPGTADAWRLIARSLYRAAEPSRLFTKREEACFKFEDVLKARYQEWIDLAADSLRLRIQPSGCHLPPEIRDTVAQLLTGAAEEINWRELARNWMDSAID